MTRVDAIVRNVAVATALPNTSCAQLNAASGVTVITLEISLRSRLSRGRSINRCGNRLTASLNR